MGRRGSKKRNRRKKKGIAGRRQRLCGLPGRLAFASQGPRLDETRELGGTPKKLTGFMGQVRSGGARPTPSIVAERGGRRRISVRR